MSVWDTPLPRVSLHAQHHALRVAQAHVVARVILETSGEPPQMHRPNLTADPVSLRGIPCQAQGVGGTCRGTDPLAALLAKQRNDRG